MDYLQRINTQKDKDKQKDTHSHKHNKNKINSVLRLTPLCLQQPANNKQKQIDDIRKKLRMLCNINADKNMYENLKQNEVKRLRKSGDLLGILLGHVRNQRNIANEKRIHNKNNDKNMEEFNQILYSVSLVKKHRKIKTEIKQTAQQSIEQCENKAKSNVKLDINKIQRRKQIQREKKGDNIQNKSNISVANYLIIKSQKKMREEKPLKRLRISEELKLLKKQDSHELTFYNSYVNNSQYKFSLSPIDQIKLSNHKINKQKQHRLLTQASENNNCGFVQVQDQQKKHQYAQSLNFIKSKKSSEILVNASQKSKQFRVKTKIKKSCQLPHLFTFTSRDFTTFIGLTNLIHPKLSLFPLKFYINKGNNDDLARRLLKKRRWTETYKMQQANFVWSQRRQQKYFRVMQKMVYINQTSNQQKTQNLYTFKCQCLQKGQCLCRFKKLILPNKQRNYTQQTQFQINCRITKITFDSLKLKSISNQKIRVHNHFAYHQQIAYKKLLFKNLKEYYQQRNLNTFQNIPVTFHIESVGCVEWANFKKVYQRKDKQGRLNLWILKPGSNTNRGTGIMVQSDFAQIRNLTSQMMRQGVGGSCSVIIQQYIMPLLYNKRKFDIRCYVLGTAVNSRFKAYWYEQGYIRTSSKYFSVSNTQNKYIHLTNDAIQKNSPDYGKFEPGNKISFEILSKYIETNFEGRSFKQDIYPQMVQLSTDAFESTHSKLHDFNKDVCFQVFGLDFMIDQNFKVWLIQVNRNPCLETSTTLLNRVIPQMLQNAFRIALDPILPASADIVQKQASDPFLQNKFRLIIDKQLKNQQRTCAEFHIIQSDSDQD